MSFPLDDNVNPTIEELYNELYLDYYEEKAKLSFPSFLVESDQFRILVRILAWAVANSYLQPRILKYIYHPELSYPAFLPRLADTLGFSYPFEYGVASSDYSPESGVDGGLSKLRLILKYLQKIRRSRGTFDSIRKLIRLLYVTERDILSMNPNFYASVSVEQVFPGIIYIRYAAIVEEDEFVTDMLKMVVPAGYKYYLETSLDTRGLSKVTRFKIDMGSYSESIRIVDGEGEAVFSNSIEDATIIFATNAAEVSSVSIGKRVLTKGEYTVSYEDLSGNPISMPEARGKYVAVVSGIAPFTGTKREEFTIN